MAMTDWEERCARLAALFERSPLQKTMGTRLRWDANGDTVVEFPVNHGFDNALGATHGGVLSALLDTAGWFAAAPAYPTWIATVDLHVQLLAPAPSELLIAKGHVVQTGAKLAVATMSVQRCDGTRIATGNGTFSVTGVPLG